MKHEQRVILWVAINELVAASGGNTGNTSVARQRAVVAVEKAIASIETTLRHGARAACKRLRGERDEERAIKRGLRCVLDKTTTERDAARLELRALEWLMGHRHIVDVEEGMIALPDHDDLDDDGTFESYASAARALGWEG